MSVSVCNLKRRTGGNPSNKIKYVCLSIPLLIIKSRHGHSGVYFSLSMYVILSEIKQGVH